MMADDAAIAAQHRGYELVRILAENTQSTRLKYLYHMVAPRAVPLPRPDHVFMNAVVLRYAIKRVKEIHECTQDMLYRRVHEWPFDSKDWYSEDTRDTASGLYSRGEKCMTDGQAAKMVSLYEAVLANIFLDEFDYGHMPFTTLTLHPDECKKMAVLELQLDRKEQRVVAAPRFWRRIFYSIKQNPSVGTLSVYLVNGKIRLHAKFYDNGGVWHAGTSCPCEDMCGTGNEYRCEYATFYSVRRDAWMPKYEALEKEHRHREARAFLLCYTRAKRDSGPETNPALGNLPREIARYIAHVARGLDADEFVEPPSPLRVPIRDREPVRIQPKRVCRGRKYVRD